MPVVNKRSGLVGLWSNTQTGAAQIRSARMMLHVLNNLWNFRGGESVMDRQAQFRLAKYRRDLRRLICFSDVMY
jgi:hypothetical protein